jgi:inorganic pyrophosphatase
MAESLLCIVKIPKGSRNNYESDPNLQRTLFNRSCLPRWYFRLTPALSVEPIPDGDPLDVLITVSEPTFPGCGVYTKPVAVSWLRDQNQRELKLTMRLIQDNVIDLVGPT